MEIDLGAERMIGAEKNGGKIAFEIRSFIKPSAISEFHMAVGQYMNYRKALGKKEPYRLLYVAVPKETYNSFFTLPFIIMDCIDEYRLKIIIYDAEKGEVTKWKKINLYRNYIKEVINRHSKPSLYGNCEIQKIFDNESDHYQLVHTGWDETERHYGCVIHLDIKNDKIWIQYDGTEIGVADELECFSYDLTLFNSHYNQYILNVKVYY